jgi:hypothetical protein
MIIGLGHEKHCKRCDGQSEVSVDDSKTPSDFFRFCLCTGRIELEPEELALAKTAYELRQQNIAAMGACGGWTAAGD